MPAFVTLKPVWHIVEQSSMMGSNLSKCIVRSTVLIKVSSSFGVHKPVQCALSINSKASSTLYCFTVYCDLSYLFFIWQPEAEERTLLQFHYTEWPCHTCPFSNAILEFRRRMRAVVGTYKTATEGPIVVHCK